MSERRVLVRRVDGVKQHYWRKDGSRMVWDPTLRPIVVDLDRETPELKQVERQLFEQTQWHKPRPPMERVLPDSPTPPSPLRLKKPQRKGVNVLEMKKEAELKKLKAEQRSRQKHGIPKPEPITKAPKYARDAYLFEQYVIDLEDYVDGLKKGIDYPYLRERLIERGVNVSALKAKFFKKNE